jgi:hypothetical protein
MHTAKRAPLLALLLIEAVAPALAADAGAGHVPADWPHVHEDHQNFGYLLVDRLEYRDDEGRTTCCGTRRAGTAAITGACG